MANFATTDSNSMRKLAGVLSNGGKSSMSLEEKVDKLCEADSWMLKYMADITENGFRTPAECLEAHKIMEGKADQMQAEHHASMMLFRVETDRFIAEQIKAANLPTTWIILGKFVIASAVASGTVLGVVHMVVGKL